MLLAKCTACDAIFDTASIGSVKGIVGALLKQPACYYSKLPQNTNPLQKSPGV